MGHAGNGTVTLGKAKNMAWVAGWCDILAWAAATIRDLLKENRRGFPFSTSETPLENDSETGILVPLRFLENTPDCLR